MSVVPVKFKGLPTHTGLLLPAEAVGVWYLVNAKGAVVAGGGKPAHDTSHTTSQAPSGMVAVDCVLAVPSRLV
jgi:hypothetical protein